MSLKAPPGPRRRVWIPAALAFLALGQALYWPALSGPFVSDDLLYLSANPWVREPTPAGILEILDPRSDATLGVMLYAPVHQLVHVAQWQLFAEWTTPYHAINTVLHATNALLLAVLLMGTGLPPGVGLAGGLFFLVHPANVEAVAWISQLKTLLAMTVMLLALLLRRERPMLATLAFGVALWTKVLAGVALPVAFVLDRTRGDRGGTRTPARSRYLIAWACLLGLAGAAHLALFRVATMSIPAISADPWERVFTSVAFGARYLVMALSGWGLSAFHEPEPVRKLADPWVLAGLLVAGALAARTLWALRQRREEGAWWLWAAGSFLPVSPLFPLIYPLADRYLYFILPGLIGGTLLAGHSLLAGQPPARRELLRGLALTLGIAAGVVLGLQTVQRAGLWGSPEKLAADTLSQYPRGPTGRWVEAQHAALAGDAPGAVAALRAATDTQLRDLEHLLGDPAFAPLRGDPGFQALIHDLARRRIAQMEARRRLSQANLVKLAHAHLLLGERAAAARAAGRALAMDGRYADEARHLLALAED